MSSDNKWLQYFNSDTDAVHGSTEGGDSFPAAAVGVGVVVGVLVAVVLATGLVLAVLLLYQNRRVISYKVTNKFGMSNPVYDGEENNMHRELLFFWVILCFKGDVSHKDTNTHTYLLLCVVSASNDTLMYYYGTLPPYSTSGSDGDAANDHLSSYHTYEGVNLNRPEERTKKERATSTDHELDNPLYEAVKAGRNVSIVRLEAI